MPGFCFCEGLLTVIETDPRQIDVQGRDIDQVEVIGLPPLARRQAGSRVQLNRQMTVMLRRGMGKGARVPDVQMTREDQVAPAVQEPPQPNGAGPVCRSAI